jgi:hypothetical protein
MTKTEYSGKFRYSYIQSGNSSENFTVLFDGHEKSTECVLKLPNKDGEFKLELLFESPDNTFSEHIIYNLKNNILHGSERILLGLNFDKYVQEVNTIFFYGDVIVEVISGNSNYHCYSCILEIEAPSIIEIFENNDLLYKNQ